MRAKLQAEKTELRRRMHEPIPEVGKWLKAVVGGHIRYYGVPGNRYALAHFASPWASPGTTRFATKPEGTRLVGTNDTADPPLAASGPYLPSVSLATLARPT